jgi:monoamine oxidase
MASEIRSFLQDSLTSADFDDIVHRSESEVATDDGVTFGTIMLGRLAPQWRSTSQVQRVSSLKATINVLDDAAADTLTGGTELDWYFKALQRNCRCSKMHRH